MTSRPDGEKRSAGRADLQILFGVLWKVAQATAAVRGGVVERNLIPGITDSIENLLSSRTMHRIHGVMLSVAAESPRMAGELKRKRQNLDRAIGRFVAAGKGDLQHAGGEALAAGAELLEALMARPEFSEDLVRHMDALAEAFRMLARPAPLSIDEAAELVEMRNLARDQPEDRQLSADLFDRESR